MTQFSHTFTITKKDNLRYNFFLMQKKLVATSALVFVIIAAMVGLLRYAQSGSVSVALINAAIMSVLGTLVLVGINIGTSAQGGDLFDHLVGSQLAFIGRDADAGIDAALRAGQCKLGVGEGG